MTWTDLHRLASDARCELLLLDSCLAALAESRNSALHGRVTAELPSTATLCSLLDQYGVAPVDEVGGQILMWRRFIEPRALHGVGRTKPAPA